MLLPRLNGLLAIADDQETQTRLLQYLGEDDLIDVVVLGHQHIHKAGSASVWNHRRR
ncbi:hypothetical protein D3C80_2168670 [compost metagenome]